MTTETQTRKDNATTIRQYMVIPAPRHPDLLPPYMEKDLNEAIKA